MFGGFIMVLGIYYIVQTNIESLNNKGSGVSHTKERGTSFSTLGPWLYGFD